MKKWYNEEYEFEIEVTDNIPENPNGTTPSKYRIYAKIMNSTIANEMKVLQNKFAI